MGLEIKYYLKKKELIIVFQQGYSSFVCMFVGAVELPQFLIK